MTEEDDPTDGSKIFGDFTWAVSKSALQLTSEDLPPPPNGEDDAQEPPLSSLQDVMNNLLGTNTANEYERKKIESIYYKVMAEFLSFFVLEDASEKSLERDATFFELCEEITNKPYNLELWKKINEDIHHFRDHEQQLRGFTTQWKVHLKYLHCYHSTLVPEMKLLFAVEQWLLSPHLSKYWYSEWFSIYEGRKSILDLRCKFTAEAATAGLNRTNDKDRHLFENFRLTLHGMENNDLSVRASQKLFEFLDDIFRPVQSEKGQARLIWRQKVMLLSHVDVANLIAKEEMGGVIVTEIALFAEHTLIIDCPLNREYMHGKNLSIVAGTVVVYYQDTVFDVSGICGCGGKTMDNVSRKQGQNDEAGADGMTTMPTTITKRTHQCHVRRGNTQTVSEGREGKDGENGKPGESSGNIAIVAAKMVNADYLTVKLNGGNGEGGQNGGYGGCGKDGKGTTKKELQELCLVYKTIFWNNRDTFKDHQFGHGFVRSSSRGSSGSGPFYFVNTFENTTDGRSIEFSLAEHKLMGVTKYDLYLLIRGGHGKAPGCGGREGIGGGGGRSGEFISMCTAATGSEFSEIDVERIPGLDGEDGIRGPDGLPAKNGHDLVMIDRSDVIPAKKYIGEAGKKISMNYHDTCYATNRLDGFRKYRMELKDCFVEFNTENLDNLPVALVEGREIASNRNERVQSQCKQTIVMENLMTEFEKNRTANISMFQALRLESEASRIETMDDDATEETITILKSNMENPAMRRLEIKCDPAELMDRILSLSGTETLDEMEEIWKEVFKVHIEDSRVIEKLDELLQRKDIEYPFPIERDWTDKKEILGIGSPKDGYEENNLLDMRNDCLLDVCEVKLTDKWIEWDSEEHKRRLLEPFLELVEKYYCHSDDVISALKGIQEALKEDEKVNALKGAVAWDDKEAVVNYFQSLNEASTRMPRQRRPNPMKLAKRKIRDDPYHPVHGYLDRLKTLVKGNIELEEHFALNRDPNGEVPEIGCDTEALIFIYFHSKRMIELNEKVRRYYKAETTILFPGKTLESMGMNKECLKMFLEKGINSFGYLQLLADEEQICIELFVRNSASSMKRIASMNSELSPKYRLFFNEQGVPFSIDSHHNSRRLKRLLSNCEVPKIALPNDDSLSKFVPQSERSLVEFWTISAKIALNSPDVTLLLRRILELSGAYWSPIEIIFVLNSCMDLVCNHNIPLAHMVNLIASTAFKNLPNWMLKLRLLAESSTWKWNPTLLNSIENGQMAALLGSRIHEIDWSDFTEKMDRVVKFLSDSAMSYNQLEHTTLEEIINLASEHTATDYGNLQRQYGQLAYYILLLRSKKDRISVIENLVENLTIHNIPILPKTLAFLTYFKCSNEDTYGLTAELTEILKLCTEASLIQPPIATEKVQQARIADLRQANCWKEVFPDKERKLEKIGQLSVNHDFTKKDMDVIITMLKNNEAPCVKKLKEINDKIEEFKGFRLRDTQKIAILCGYLHDKNLVSQVVTGEGKTLIIVALSILYITLDGRTVDVITSSSVLAKRDADDYKDIYNYFEIKVTHNCEEDIEKRKHSYAAHIVYGDVAHFERDFLLHFYYQKNVLGNRERSSTIAIVDEVDSMLLDHGSNMLYLSHHVTGLEMLEPLFVFIHKLIQSTCGVETVMSLKERIKKAVLMDLFGMLTKEDIRNLDVTLETATYAWNLLLRFDVIDCNGILKPYSKDLLFDLGTKLITKCGLECAQRILALLKVIKERRRTINIPKHLLEFARDHLEEFIDSAVKSIFMKKNDEYVIDVDRTQRSGDLHPVVTIIDKGTGTDLRSSQWTNGLHQFLQLANGCRVTPLSLKAVFISNVTFLKGYKKINGLSGTLGSREERKCLKELYDADVMRIPTCKPRMFATDVPVVTATQEEWVKSIYDSVKDKLLANRSVLIICSTINDVEKLSVELPSLCHRLDPNEEQLTEAFKAAQLYRRDTETFEIEKGGLKCGRLVISTNLAGRGTDIRLCEELRKNGGLHVIVGLCDNQRIEDQAFGRAARCGDYGSGQIIALAQDVTSANIFNLQNHRDLVEQQRLRSLKKYYDYHINVEEECLKLFMEHCRELLQTVHGQDDYSSTPAIKYFALLDLWALELDRISEEIRNCEKSEDEERKQSIIQQVAGFIQAFDLSSKEVEPPEWITRPQPLLHFALVMVELKNYETAVSLLHKIADAHQDFVGEVFYYLGAFMQQNIKQKRYFRRERNREGWTGSIHDRSEDVKFFLLRKLQDVAGDEISSLMELNKESMNEAVGYLLLAKAEFMRRMENEAQLCATVVQLNGKGSAGGYRAQKQEAISVWEAFVDSIDQILGKHASNTDLRNEKESDEMAVARRKVLTHAGILSPPVLQNIISCDHLMHIAQKHSLPLTQLKNLIDSIQNDTSLPEYEGRRIVDVKTLSRISIPNAVDFWGCLQKEGVLCCERIYIALKKSVGDVPGLPCAWRKSSIVLGPLDIALNNCDSELFDFYELNDLTIIENPELNSNLHLLLSASLACIEIIGTVNPLNVLKELTLDKYDFITSSIVMEELDVTAGDAKWILQKLIGNGILEMCSDFEGETRFVTRNRLDFSSFPEGMRESLWTIFTRHFSYGYALKSLKASVRDLKKGEKLSYRILLPSSPHSELFEDMIASGIVVQSRVSSMLSYYESKEVFSFLGLFGKSVNFLPKWLYGKLEHLSPRLTGQKCTLEKTHEYMKRHGVATCSALRNAVSNGLVKTVKVNRQSQNSWLPAVFFKAISCLLTTKLRFFGKAKKHFSTIEAKIGSNEYFMQLTKENQKEFALSDVSFEEEFTELRKCHQEAVVSMSAYLKHNKKVEYAQTLINSRIKEVRDHILRHAFVTHCKRTVAVEKVSKCVTECGLRPMLEESVSSFMMFTIRESVVEVLQAVDNDKKFELNELYLLNSVVAFARGVIVDVNNSIKSSRNDDDDDDELKPELVNMETVERGISAVDQERILTSSQETMQSVLAQELHKLLNEKIDGVFRNQVQPMIKKMIQSWEEEGCPSANCNNETDELYIEEGCKNETFSIQGQHPFLFRDLYNIFLKLTFKEAKRSVVAHMVKYNFPLGTHCTALVGSGVVQLLAKSLIPLKLLEISLIRGSETVYKIACTEKQGGVISCSLELSLENNCFFAGSDIINEHAHSQCSLFDAIRKKIPEISKEYPEENTFLAHLSDGIAQPNAELMKQWNFTEEWTGAEKLRCAVKF